MHLYVVNQHSRLRGFLEVMSQEVSKNSFIHESATPSRGHRGPTLSDSLDYWTAVLQAAVFRCDESLFPSRTIEWFLRLTPRCFHCSHRLVSGSFVRLAVSSTVPKLLRTSFQRDRRFCAIRFYKYMKFRNNVYRYSQFQTYWETGLYVIAI